MKRIFVIAVLTLIAVSIWGGSANQPSTSKHLLIISIDGLRPDALLKANTPHIDWLWKEGSYTWSAQTIMPSSTLPGHASMLTGLTPERHGVTWNSWKPSRGYVTTETIFEIAHNTGLTTAMFIGKEKLKHLAKPGTVDFFSYPGHNSEIIAKTAWEYIAFKEPNLTFIHLPDPNGLGHKYGWMSDEQLQGVERADEAVNMILNALWLAEIVDQTTIIITSDHGGHGNTHGTDDPKDLTIPWIINGPSIKQNYAIQSKVNVYDTTTTGLFALGISVSENLDGKVISEAFRILEPTAEVKVNHG